jgi:hypothetical protein
MTWLEFGEKYNQRNVSGITITLMENTRLICKDDGTVIVQQRGGKSETLICLALHRTPAEMDAIITSLTEK